jgi:predicted nucleic acid-binding protein
VKVLLDTCVLAELRHPKGLKAVREAVAAFADEDLFLSVVTMGEVAKGVALLAESKKKRELAQWLAGLDRQFGEQILIVDRDTAMIWGEITARAQHKGVQIPALDGLIAATALRHGLHVMTRNTKDFAATGVLVIDPWNVV